MSILRIPRQHLEHLEKIALETYPEECCGVLLGQARSVSAIWPAANIHDGAKSDRYAIDPLELLEVYKSTREGGREVIGYYHSHPDRAAIPSATDLASAVPDVYREMDPDNHLLWRAPRVRLAAEAIRDNALATAGLLSSEIGGPPVFPYQPDGYYLGKAPGGMNSRWPWKVGAG